MDETESLLFGQEVMSHQEIVRRFKRLFNRDMTPDERRAFFLDDPVLPTNAQGS